MVEVPEEDDGKLQIVELVDVLVLVALRLEAVLARGLQQVVRLAPVARHAAFVAQLFERHPASVVGKDVRQRGGAALDGLHLEDRRRTYALVRSLLDCLRWRFGDCGFCHGPTLGLCGSEPRSEEHTSELQSHSFISYAVFSLKQN